MIVERNVWVCLLLSLVTGGLYSLYWFVKMTDETNEVAGMEGMSGLMSLLLVIVTCGLYFFVWAYHMGDRLDTARSQNGANTGNFPLIFLVLTFLGLSIINYCIIQSELNKYVPAY